MNEASEDDEKFLRDFEIYFDEKLNVDEIIKTVKIGGKNEVQETKEKVSVLRKEISEKKEAISKIEKIIELLKNIEQAEMAGEDFYENNKDIYNVQIGKLPNGDAFQAKIESIIFFPL